MKKLVLTLAVALGGLFTVNAQGVGQMWVGGTVGVWSSKIKGGDSQLSFKVLPEFGYVVSDNIAIGISLGGGHTHLDGEYVDPTSFKGSTSGSESMNFYRVNPFVRYAFLKGTLGSLFVDGGVGYELQKVTGGGAKGQMIDVGFKPGIALSVSEKVSLIGKFGFLGYEYTKVGDVKRNSFGFDFDMNNIELGMCVKF